MVISGFDYQMYQDEIAELRDEMTQLLISMEYYHQTLSRQKFEQWWEGEGHLRRYFECKGRIEQIEGYLSRVQVEETEHPRMRHGGMIRKHYGAGQSDESPESSDGSSDSGGGSSESGENGGKP